MDLPQLSTRTVESDPYRTVVIHSGALILAECNGSSKADVATEIAHRCNAHNRLLDRHAELIRSVEALISCADHNRDMREIREARALIRAIEKDFG